MESSQLHNEPIEHELRMTLSPDNSLETARVTQPSRKIQSIEVSVFLLLIVPSMALSFLSGPQAEVRFASMAIASILNDLALLSLVLYFIWRNQESVRELGWNFDRLRADIALGLILFAPVFFAGNALASLLHDAGLSAPARQPSFLAVSGASQIALGVLIVTVVAIVEETVFRGYLMLRFATVTGRRSAAVILSSLVFSLGHGYEGTAGAVSVFVLGAIFAVVYLWRKSVVAPIVIHFLTDFTSLVVPALLSEFTRWH